MALRMTVTDVQEIDAGLWLFSMPPHQVRHFGNTNQSIGSRSVVVVRRYEYDAANAQLHFEADDIRPINIGKTSEVLALAEHIETNNEPNNEDPLSLLAPGDKEFLQLAKNDLSEQTYWAAEKLLFEVRRRSPGNLKRGQSRNFSETPDNFWYVIVQPRADELSLTVRGSVEHFSSVAKLEIKDDRGNTRFKVRSEKDVPAAIDLIFHAIRKR